MAFQNPSIDPDALPSLEAAVLAPVAARYAHYRTLTRGARWAVLALLVWWVPVGELALGAQGGAAALIALLGAASTVFGWVEARGRAFGLREHDLIYRRGLLVRRTTVLPLRRIQHVETASGPLERAFDLVRVRCYTAGGASADLVLEGLRREPAERVRQYLLARIAADEAPV